MTYARYLLPNNHFLTEEEALIALRKKPTPGNFEVVPIVFGIGNFRVRKKKRKKRQKIGSKDVSDLR